MRAGFRQRLEKLEAKFKDCNGVHLIFEDIYEGSNARQCTRKECSKKPFILFKEKYETVI